MRNESAKRALWWICLVVAPLILVLIELFHPAGFTNDPGMYAYLSRPEQHSAQHKALDYFGPTWWFVLHMIQTPLVGLVAVGLWLLMEDVRSEDAPFAIAFAWISRVATFVFLVYYTALDAIGGIGLGRTIVITESLVEGGALSPEQKAGVVQVLDAAWKDRWIGGVGSFISLTGSWAILAAAGSAVVALFLTKRVPVPALFLLIGFGWEVQLSHASFHGPIGFSVLAFFALWVAWSRKRSRGGGSAGLVRAS